VPASRGDELIDRLRAGGNDSSANDLLTEVFRGHPVESLRRLLHGDEETAAKAEAWILSELGVRAAPMMADIVALLGLPAAGGGLSSVGNGMMVGCQKLR
jgi:hypothetical protein